MKEPRKERAAVSTSAKKESPEPKYRTITVREDVFLEFEKQKDKQQSALGFTELSWTNFLAFVTQRLKENGRSER